MLVHVVLNRGGERSEEEKVRVGGVFFVNHRYFLHDLLAPISGGGHGSFSFKTIFTIPLSNVIHQKEPLSHTLTFDALCPTLTT